MYVLSEILNRIRAKLICEPLIESLYSRHPNLGSTELKLNTQQRSMSSELQTSLLLLYSDQCH
jgi:hypothetical protein